MFDDKIPQPNANPPSNLPLAPNEPEDMFADTEKNGTTEIPQIPNALASGKLKPKEQMVAGASFNIPQGNQSITKPLFPPSEGETPAVYTMKEPVLGKVILIVVLILLLTVLIGFGVWAYNKYVSLNENNFVSDVNNEQTGTTTVENNNEDMPAVNGATNTAPIQNENINSAPTNTEIIQDVNNDKVLFGEAVDSDRDGLDDIREKQLGTDPNKVDTDEDGLPDGDEVLIWKTDPLNKDTDGDSYADGLEVKSGYNPRGAGRIFDTVSTASNTSSVNKN